MIFLVLFGLGIAMLAILTSMAFASGKKEVVNETQKKTLDVQKAQLDIANRPADSDSNIIQWLRDDSDK